MDVFKNGVGRPSKEIIRKRRIIKALLVALVAFLGGGLLYIFAVVANITPNYLGNAVNKPANYKKVISKTPTYYKRGFYGQALQGATIADGQIYYATTVAGASKKSDYKSSIRMLGLYSESAIGHFKPVISKSRKINDITTKGGRNYYISFSLTSGVNSHIYYSHDNIPRYAELQAEDMFKSFATIAYNDADGLFYSLSGGKKGHIVYTYQITMPTNKNNKQDAIIAKRTCKFYKNPAHVVDANTISNQGITIKDNKLYQAYVVHPGGQSNFYRNYVAVYDLSNCHDKLTTYPEYTYKVGTCNTNTTKSNCEIETVFFMGDKAVLGYNNNKFNTSYFYTTTLS